MTLAIRDRDGEERLGLKEEERGSEEMRKGCKGLKENTTKRKALD